MRPEVSVSAEYNPEAVRRFYDGFGEGEWERLDADPRGRVIFHVHRWYLRQFVRAGDRVLEAGAGPGRFTIELARIGACVTVGDISPRQLEINRRKVEEAGLEAQVAERVPLDILDCSRYPDGHFDAVVCYGSPICYVAARADEALAEMLRVLRSGGHLLLSVAARVNMHLPWLLDTARRHGLPALQRYVETGDLEGDPLHCYRWSELQALLERQPAEIVAVSASNVLATVAGIPLLEEIEKDRALWEAFLQWEIDLGREPGAIDSGSHIVAVLRRP